MPRPSVGGTILLSKISNHLAPYPYGRGQSKIGFSIIQNWLITTGQGECENWKQGDC